MRDAALLSHTPDPKLDELGLDGTFLERARVAQAADHEQHHELHDSMATAAEMASNDRGDVSGFHQSFDPAEAPMSILEAMQRDQELQDAHDIAEAERAIGIIGTLDRGGLRAYVGRPVRHRREDH